MGLNPALRWAIARLASGSILILLPDTPLVTPAEILSLVSKDALGAPPAAFPELSPSSERWAAAAPDRALVGTNALFLQPSLVLAPAFGRGSLARHRDAAIQAGARFTVRQMPGISLDIDTRADVAAFLRTPSDTRTWRLLDQLHQIGRSECSGLV